MFFNKAIIGLLFLYFFSAGITWVEGEAGSGISGRVTFADIIGVLLIVLACFQVLTKNRAALFIPSEYKWYVPFLFILIVSMIFSAKPLVGLLEILVHFYIFVVSLFLINIFKNNASGDLFEKLLLLILYSGGALAAIGLLQFFVLPSLFLGVHGGLSGTFRNTGQAGAFFSTYLAVLIPGFLTGLIKPRIRNYFILTIILMALLFTFKRSAQIGFIVGAALIVLKLLRSSSIRDKKIGAYVFMAVALLTPLGLVLFYWGIENISGMAWRFSNKVNANTIQSFSEGFLAENLNGMWKAFTDKPLFGVGPANVAGVYTLKYELHSTYMKIIATTGLVGTLAYVLFMLSFFINIFKARSVNVYGRYLSYFFPLYIGLVISWAYTYHLRKREFWILFAIISFALFLYKNEHKSGVLK